MKESKQQIPSYSIWIYIIASFIGIAETIYLNFKLLRGEAPSCGIIQGCDQVLTSSYAEIFGIPVSVYGMLFYLATFFLVLIYRDTKSMRIGNLAMLLTVAGFVFSLYFLYIMAFVLQAYCTYCLGSLSLWTIMFVTTLFTWKKVRRKRASDDSSPA